MVLHIERLVHKGLGLSHHMGKVCLVEYGAPLDVVKVEVTRERSDYIEATVIEVIENGPYSGKPQCNLFYQCGGCQIQHIKPEAQARLKRDILIETIERTTKLPIKPEVKISSGEVFRYRGRLRLHAKGGKVGLYKSRSRDIVEVGSCYVVKKQIENLFQTIRECIDRFPDWAGNIDLVMDVDGRVSIVIRGRIEKRMSEVMLENPNIIGVWNGHDNYWEFLGESPLLRWHTLDKDQTPMPILIDPRGFCQSNPEMNLKLVSTVLEYADAKSNHTILDLYCGGGNLTFPLVSTGAKVIGVESDPYSICAGKETLKMLGIPSDIFVLATVEEHFLSLATNLRHISTVIADPPRAGLGRMAGVIANARPDKIILVSCEVSSLGRDLGILFRHGYQLAGLTMIDMFPQTFHIESVALLVRCS